MAKLYIKNMVCSRCTMVVKTELKKAGVVYTEVVLGEVTLAAEPDKAALLGFDKVLKELGFELIDDKKSQTIEKIKNCIVELVHHSEDGIKTNLSDYIAARLHYEYGYLSGLFSEVEGTTIEKYYIAQRIEKAKELLVYNELSLSEIADKLGYSSTAHLSGQFKKVTGLTPSFYKSLKENKRRNIEDV